MTNEKRLELITAMVHDYDAKTGNSLAEKTLSEPQTVDGYAAFPFYACAASLVLECLAGMERTTTTAQASAAVKRIATGSTNQRMWGIATEDNENFYACDGYRGVCIRHDLPSIARVERDNRERIVNLCSGTISNARKAGKEALAIPSAAQVKAYISTHKRKDGKKTIVEPMKLETESKSFYVLVNPNYLLDMLYIFPTLAALTCHKTSSLHPDADWSIAQIYIDGGKDGEGILCPVNPTH